MNLLRSIGYGQRSTQEKIIQEANTLKEEFAKHEGRPFDPQRTIHLSVTNVICSLLFDEQYKHNDKEFLKLLAILNVYLQQTFGHLELSMFPLLRLLPKNREYIKRYKINSTALLDFIRSKVEKRKSSLSIDNEPCDFIQVRIKIRWTHTYTRIRYVILLWENNSIMLLIT